MVVIVVLSRVSASILGVGVLFVSPGTDLELNSCSGPSCAVWIDRGVACATSTRKYCTVFSVTTVR